MLQPSDVLVVVLVLVLGLPKHRARARARAPAFGLSTGKNADLWIIYMGRWTNHGGLVMMGPP